MKYHGVLACLGFALTLSASAQDILVEDLWARESPPGVTNGAAYMTLVNQTSDTDRLLSASAPVSERVELHTHLMEDGVMKMRQIEAIEVAPGAPTVLEPGGLHVMFIGLEAPLVDGEQFPLTLNFENAGEVTVEVPVQRPAGMMQGHGHGHGN